MEPERSRRLEGKKVGHGARNETATGRKAGGTTREENARLRSVVGTVKKESSIREYTRPETRKALVARSRVKESGKGRE